MDFIVVRGFRWPCYQIQVNTPVDVWSNHACQVALFFPSISTACSSRSVRSCPVSELLAQVGGSVNTRSCPASGNAPLGNPREPTGGGGVLSKVDQEGLSRWSCCHWIWGKECTLTPSSRSESELLDLHGPRRLKKSKDKGKRPKQRRIAKGPSDHQARRRSRKETLTQVAQNGREWLSSTKKMQWMRTAKKVQ